MDDGVSNYCYHLLFNLKTVCMDAYRVNGPQMERRPRIPMITRLASLKRRYTSSTMELDEMEHHASPMMERPRNARMESYTNMMGTETSIYATISTCCPNILFLFIPGCLCWADGEFSYMDSATTEIFSGYETSLRSGREPAICFTWC